MSLANSIMSYNIKRQLFFLHRIILLFAYFSTALMILGCCTITQSIATYHIPIIPNIWFIIGIALFTAINLINSILNLFNHNNGSLLDISSKSIALIVQIAFLVLVLSFYNIQYIIAEYPIDLNYYYQMVFLGYGHILEFLYSNLLIIIWIIFIQKILPRRGLRFISLQTIFICCNVLFVSISPMIYLFYRIDDYYILEFFNTQAYLIYVAPCCSFLLIVINLFTYRKKIGYQNIACFSLVLSGIIFLTASIMKIVSFKDNNLYYYSIAIAVIAFIYMRLSTRWEELQGYETQGEKDS